MRKYQKKIASAIAAGAMLLNVAMPAAAATYTVQGNGSDSTNDISVDFSGETTVTQDNDYTVTNDVELHLETGDNEAEDNTGGDVSIETGDIESDVSIYNAGNTNVAEVEGCCQTDNDVLIKGNGEDSDNDVDLDLGSDVELSQDNAAEVDNDVEVKASTGDNEVEGTTGGDVEIKTGSVKSEEGISISNVLNVNSAVVAGESSGDLSARIVGNGTDTDNDIDLDFDPSIKVTQDNDAGVDNDVELKAETGDNEAEDNTGGEVSIDTGDVEVDVMVDTVGNFNWAEADACGCLFESGDVSFEILKNGEGSDNKIELTYEESGLEVDQDNAAEVDNDLDELKANTGDNEAEDNTAGDGEDPDIETGDIEIGVEVGNELNSNLFNSDEGYEFEVGGSTVVLHLDLGDLLDWILGQTE